MSLNLECPNCHSVIGEVSNKDNYINHFYHHNEKGEPICPNCGTGDELNAFDYGMFIIGLVFFASFVIWGIVELIKIL